MKGYNLISLENMINEVGESTTKSILSDFSSPKNKDVEYFLHEKSFEFLKLGITKTFLLFSSYKDKPVLLGYFAICMKVAVVPQKALTANIRRKVFHFSSRNPNNPRSKNNFELPIPLIAQLGKNYSVPKEVSITGDELLKMACDKVKEAQTITGGKFVYLECGEIDKLKTFYESNGFVCFAKRLRGKEETEMVNEKYYLQMIKYLG